MDHLTMFHLLLMGIALATAFFSVTAPVRAAIIVSPLVHVIWWNLSEDELSRGSKRLIVGSGWLFLLAVVWAQLDDWARWLYVALALIFAIVETCRRFLDYVYYEPDEDDDEYDDQSKVGNLLRGIFVFFLGILRGVLLFFWRLIYREIRARFDPLFVWAEDWIVYLSAQAHPRSPSHPLFVPRVPPQPSSFSVPEPSPNSSAFSSPTSSAASSPSPSAAPSPSPAPRPRSQLAPQPAPQAGYLLRSSRSTRSFFRPAPRIEPISRPRPHIAPRPKIVYTYGDRKPRYQPEFQTITDREEWLRQVGWRAPTYTDPYSATMPAYAPPPPGVPLPVLPFWPSDRSLVARGGTFAGTFVPPSAPGPAFGTAAVHLPAPAPLLDPRPLFLRPSPGLSACDGSFGSHSRSHHHPSGLSGPLLEPPSASSSCPCGFPGAWSLGRSSSGARLLLHHHLPNQQPGDGVCDSGCCLPRWCRLLFRRLLCPGLQSREETASSSSARPRRPDPSRPSTFSAIMAMIDGPGTGLLPGGR
ncbi:uncharacterized protein EI97DRAFT_233174 [Westerdykella ornata]|uniref:Uncharacterized protein n=1 Tax=Westerdykella ornata TaxID=318751 RepID=A0A6A6J6H0_WESOR|nr:uncharacterized protein EI97DRAFT_233174 [Westerdykella ornata]KAF2272171.1 hypothetical protein EI97DRAFT_233174 [Westerdykella ornata]